MHVCDVNIFSFYLLVLIWRCARQLGVVGETAGDIEGGSWYFLWGLNNVSHGRITGNNCAK